MGGHFTRQAPLPAVPYDEGFHRAAEADKEMAAGSSWYESKLARFGGAHDTSEWDDKLFGPHNGIRAKGSNMPCHPTILKAAYMNLQDSLEKGMEACMKSPLAQCKSCKWRMTNLQQADEMTRFLSRVDLSNLEDRKPLSAQDMSWPAQTGESCYWGKCKKSGPNADCIKGKCECKSGYVASEGKCMYAPGEAAGTVPGDAYHIDGSEVSKLGQALALTQLAGHNARMDIAEEMRPGWEDVPDKVSGHIANAQQHAWMVAGLGFRCRSTVFLEVKSFL